MKFESAERIVRSSPGADAEGKTLLDYLCCRFPYHTREDWNGKIAAGLLFWNGSAASAGTVLGRGGILEYRPGDLLHEPEVDGRFDTLYEDDDVIVIAKSGNLPSHPAGPFFKHTLWYLLREKYHREIYLFHRLDRETSGVMLLAKSPEVIRTLNLCAALKKEYLALVFGNFPATLQADGFLVKDEASAVRKKQKFVAGLCPGAPDSARARTEFVLERSALCGETAVSLVRAFPETGRFHQIRATLCSLGFPLLGDKLYGPDERIYLKLRGDELTTEDRRKLILPRQALHAEKLEFTHPRTKERMSFSAPIPEEWNVVGICP